MPTPVIVTGMRLVEADLRGDGTRLVATFEATFPTFRLAGCLIIIDILGVPMAYPPEARSRTRDLPPITITDYDLLRAMRCKAVRLYEAMADKAEAA